MDALRKANPDELELMHGLTAAKTLEFVDALIQFKTSAAGLGVGSASGAGELELSVPWDLLPYAQLELNGRYSNAVPEPVGRWVYRADARRARRSNSTSSITSSGSTGAGISTRCASSARDISSERVVVRFVRRYGADAHRAWAAAGLAPALYAVRPLAGDWLLLEMELLSKEAGWVNLAQLVVAAADAAAAAAAAAARGGAGGGGATAAAAAGGRDGASWAAADGTIPALAAMQRAVASVRAALDRAHAVQSARRGRGPGRAVVFAHGDVRPQNIMVRLQEGGRAGLGAGGGSDESSADAGGGGVGGEGYDVRFLDFEFAGAVGAARYPPSLNMVRMEAGASACIGLLLYSKVRYSTIPCA
ncbi:hypothetical protein CHLRE_06g298050v5 [Chlamydomonas reinhardtii]|uniref:Uncharacterized protein n=1 Tax=Chlamydomonas reinhardtii TaxID=3055 RepID=A0A2K3DQX0_CHLRE|nr:uncharacterized protein CHLRE_06g298050v5 [Chlamydomonas reinhardtii]PNW82878.1 hypothetical protein CHLRE_06g298050v5 [Chlamydomonas reinhardtii]